MTILVITELQWSKLTSWFSLVLFCFVCLLYFFLSHLVFSARLLNDCQIFGYFLSLNPIALRSAETPLSFGRSECNRVKGRFVLCQIHHNYVIFFLQILVSICNKDIVKFHCQV